MPNAPSHVSSARAALTAAPAGLVAVAPCYFELQASVSDTGPVWIQATPSGKFRARDGRPEDVPFWNIDAAIAARVLAELRRNATPLVVDYEHQTLNAVQNGQPAPAAGYFRDGEWRDGSGLWLRVELTPRARQYVRDGEYRYFSPVFFYDDKTGDVKRIVMGAITNNPAIDDMAQVELRAAARFVVASQSNSEETAMKEFLIALCAALGIQHEGRPEADVQKDVIAALNALKGKADAIAPLRAALGQPETATADQLVAACGELKKKATTAATASSDTPDPAKFVAVDVVQQLQGQIAALTASQQAREIDDLVKPALGDGRLLPAQEAWARELGKANLASLRSYLDQAQPIAALTGSQTNGKAPNVTKDPNGLSSDELAICTQMGLDPKDFAAAKTS
jgi:phage I-like protein